MGEAAPIGFVLGTKTSFALFLLYCIFHFEGTKQGDQQMQDGMPSADKAAARSIVFNVKGEDMLFFDKPNKGLTDDHRAVYAKMGLPTTPFTDLRFFTSPKSDSEVPSPSTEQRQEGVTLIGAQQSASRVEKRITGNASIRVNGRLDFAESQSPEYDYLPESFRLRSTIIKPGTMIVHEPDIPAPVLINFPLPAWATRGEEVDDQDLDRAAREFAGRF